MLAILSAGPATHFAQGGDKIVFSESKPQTDPNAAASASQKSGDLFKSWNKLEQPAFDYSILGIPTLPRQAVDAKEEKRLRNARDEKRNWMFLKPGELQQKEEEKTTLGVANRPLDGFEKENHSSDYTFYNVAEGKTGAGRQPGELRAPGQTSSREEQAAEAKALQQQRDRDDEDSEKRRDRTFTLSGQSEMGAHTAGELNFTGLFDPGKSAAALGAAPGNSDFSLRDALAATPLRTKEQQARMDEFNKMLNSPMQSGSSPGPGPSFSPSLATAPPSFSRPSDSFSGKASSGASYNYNSGYPINAGYSPVLQNRLNPPGLPTIGTAPAYPNQSLFGQQAQPPATDSSKNWTRLNQDPPRRKF